MEAMHQMVQTKRTSASDLAPTTLRELLEPFSLEDFLGHYGKKFLHIAGPSGKFTKLFPWDVLNTVLRQHRLNFPRLRLFLDGNPVPVESYSKEYPARRQRSVAPRLLPAELIQQLQNGATLVVDAVDELYEPLTSLAESLELLFHEHIQINLYTGWHTSPGFDLHWDDHDVIVLQLDGRKSWAVYGESRRLPLTRDLEKNITPPESPIWQDTLTDGDLLYIPRGWWHVATPLAEPSLHLTIGIPNRTGIDLFTWFAEQLRTQEEFRMDLPRFRSLDEQHRYYATLFDYIRSQLNDELVNRFLAHHDSIAAPRLRLNLPDTADRKSLKTLVHKRFKLNVPRSLRITEEDNQIQVSCNGKHLRFDKKALSLLQQLDSRKAFTLDELVTAGDGVLDEKTVSIFIEELISQGLVEAEE